MENYLEQYSLLGDGVHIEKCDKNMPILSAKEKNDTLDTNNNCDAQNANMSDFIKFTLNVIPTAQQRPRVTRFGAHKSKTQIANENTLEAMLLEHMPKTPFSGAISVAVKAYMPIPKSVSKKKREILVQETTPCLKHKDIDNLCKQLLDCLTRLRFWKDDCLVYSLKSEKFFSDSPRWEVSISNNEDILCV